MHRNQKLSDVILPGWKPLFRVIKDTYVARRNDGKFAIVVDLDGTAVSIATRATSLEILEAAHNIRAAS
jgi:hypothetical protein